MGADQRKKGVCQTLVRFLFSHVGLIIMIIAYVVAGAFIFEHLEQPNEHQLCYNRLQNYNPIENNTLEKLWNVHQDAIIQNYVKDDLKVYLKSYLTTYMKEVLESKYDMTNCSSMGTAGGPQFDWSWSGALLFSITVVSTIGYGNIAPLTTWGRVVCIAYAMLGIPLMLLCLGNIGEVMADVFKFIYTKICCCGCCQRKIKGQGQNQDEYSDSDDEDIEEITVPLTITMCVIFGYLIGGSLLFAVWENWSAITAFYFCFITLTTIGFGDLVPGTTSVDSAYGQIQMGLAGLYVLFGLAIISMCFNLMQDEMVAKFKWLGEKIGLVDKSEDSEDIDDLEGKAKYDSYDVISKIPSFKTAASQEKH